MRHRRDIVQKLTISVLVAFSLGVAIAYFLARLTASNDSLDTTPYLPCDGSPVEIRPFAIAHPIGLRLLVSGRSAGSPVKLRISGDRLIERSLAPDEGLGTISYWYDGPWTGPVEVSVRSADVECVFAVGYRFRSVTTFH